MTGAQLDLGPVKERNRDLLRMVVRLTLLGDMPTPEDAAVFWERIVTAGGDVHAVIGELEPLRAAWQKARDIHMPQASADPAVTGAICTGCSVHGALVPWPCATWNALDAGR